VDYFTARETKRGKKRRRRRLYAAHADEIKLPPVDMPLIVCKKASRASERSLCNVTLGGSATLGARRETTPATVTIITIMTCWSTFIELYSCLYRKVGELLLGASARSRFTFYEWFNI
jgi:hypothetical protein